MPPEADGRRAILQHLAERRPVDHPVALLVAHPDDEIIGAGGVLPLMRRLLLIHVTDGAPRDGGDSRAHGFADPASYAAARRAELSRALAMAGVAPPTVELGAPDQGASDLLVPLTRALRAAVPGHVVLTHPYEGGHPDHDATAFIAAQCGAPVLEFAGYHAEPGGSGMRTGAFLPGPWPEPVRIVLTAAEAHRKRAALAAFATQAATLAPFGATHELFRAAPRYDWRRPPHPGTLHYERFPWGMSGARWRSLAAAAAALC